VYDSSSTDTAVPNTIWHIVLKANEAISRSFLLLNQRRGVAGKGGEAGTKKKQQLLQSGTQHTSLCELWLQ